MKEKTVKIGSATLLEVKNLSVAYQISGRQVAAVTDAGIDVRVGEGIGIVGESGSGKSTFARALMGLLPPSNAQVKSGQMRLGDQMIALADKAAIERVRGNKIAMVFQDPLSYLNPLMTVRAQILEGIKLNDPGAAVEVRTRELLDLVRLPHRVLAAHPHELSGGMRQRVLLAIALGCRPQLLIADEPTTALDVTTQAEILTLLNDIMRELRMSLILISHDLGVVASLCDRVFVMYGGRTIESGPRDRILSQPGHPYTQALVLAARSVRTPEGKFVTLSGETQKVAEGFTGCGFMPRCTYARPECILEVPPMVPMNKQGSDKHLVRCILQAVPTN